MAHTDYEDSRNIEQILANFDTDISANLINTRLAYPRLSGHIRLARATPSMVPAPDYPKSDSRYWEYALVRVRQ